ncbi:MAG: efflux RND transporter permease subunit, partial [Bacteroidota bacterium]
MANQQKQRSFGLTNLAVNNGTSVFLLAFMILAFGLLAYQNIPKEQFPEVSFPTVYINTPYFGNSAEDIESLVTRPMEKELQSVVGVKTIRSTSIQDFSVITVEFNSDEDLDEAVRRVKDAVDLAKPELPTDLDQEPTVLEIDLSQVPIMTVNISGDFSQDDLRRFGEAIQDELENIGTVSTVELRGAQEREVEIAVDYRAMQALQVNFFDIERAITAENLTLSAGEIDQNGLSRAVRVVGEYEDPRNLENLIVKAENQRTVFLKDIADVSFDFEKPTSIARSDLLPVVSLDVIKRAGENLLSTADEVNSTLDRMAEILPENLKIAVFNDQSINTRNEVRNLENSIISGVLLVVLVLLFFLGLRNALFVGIAIPLSMLMGILWLYLTGVTLNIVVLFALILALGLLVDNGIVVVENIYRYRQEGADSVTASKLGAAEVALPIIASTATTLAAFLPLAFWPGIIGEFMKYFPITLILVLSSSLIVALVINPVFTQRLMTIDERAETAAGRKRKRFRALRNVAIMVVLGIIGFVADIDWLLNLMILTAGATLLYFFVLRPGSFYFQNKALPALERGYDRFIRFALRNAGKVFFGTILLLVVSIALSVISPPKIVFFPSADPIYVNAFVELPIGSEIQSTNSIAGTVEERIIDVIEPYGEVVDAVLTQIGENTADPNGLPEPGVTPHRARITISFVPYQERDGVSTADIMTELRDAVGGIPGAIITVDKNADGPATGKPINLEVSGDDLDKLVDLSDDLIAYLNAQNIAGIEELTPDIKLGKPELIVNVDREAARRFGISTQDVALALRTAIYGREVSKYKLGEDDYPIFIRLREQERNRIEDLLSQRITFQDPSNGQIKQVPLQTVTDVEYSSTYSAIKRKDLERVLTVFSNVLTGYNANEIIVQLEEAMEGYQLPRGFTWEFTGEQQQQAEDSAFLGGAFLVALFTMFIIIVAQFNSLSSPFIIMMAVLFSTIGVGLGYFFFGGTFSVVFTGVGIISLAGVVVNNAIVLIDYTKLIMQQKAEEQGITDENGIGRDAILDSIIEGGSTRLRPVLLTAITTVLGLIPLAIGFNFNFFTLVSRWDPQFFLGGDNTALWGPMAWTVIYGLV